MTKGELREFLRSIEDLPDDTMVVCPGEYGALYPAKHEIIGDRCVKRIIFYPDDKD